MLQNPSFSPLTLSSTKKSKSWLLSLSQPHTSSYFSFKKAFPAPFFPPKHQYPSKTRFQSNSPDFLLNFPSSSIIKPYTISERWLINVDLPIQDSFSETSRNNSSHKISKKKRKKKRLHANKVKNVVKRHALGFSSIENLDFF